MAIISPIVGQGTTTATYQPAMMKFDGSTGYYSDTYTSSGNKVSVVLRFNVSSFTGGTEMWLLTSTGPDVSGTRYRVQINISASDHATADYQDRVRCWVRNSAGTIICRFLGGAGTHTDGEDHVLFFSFDGDNGTAVFRIDGVDADDTGNASRVAPTTGTLDSGASTLMSIGGIAASHKVNGTIGFVGYRDAYLTNYTSFMDGSTPKELDESGWTEWGAQPLFWNEHGDMVNNKGSAGAMTHGGLALSPQDLSGIVVADY